MLQIQILHISAKNTKSLIFKNSNSINLKVILEEYADLKIEIINNAKTNTVHNQNIQIFHTGNYSKSSIISKSILRQGVVINFCGEIIVENKASNTVCEMINSNLILSPNILTFNEPKLRINNPDTRAKHANSNIFLSESSLFYLMSKGMSDLESKKLLIKSFLYG